VPAGNPVDAVIEELLLHLEPEDLVIDGGNSRFTDTNRRIRSVESKGFLYLGMGISGGESGARRGPSLMPGGTRKGYERIEKILKAAAARVDNDPCVAYLGPGSVGHYVKMVHNGIEYALMQLISETYDLMKQGLQMESEELHVVFDRMNQEELSSYLIEITADIFLQKDEKAGHVLKGPRPHFEGERELMIHRIKNALYAAMIIAFSQGMALLTQASKRYEYGLDPATVARIWRGGCIIRAALLEHIRFAYQSNPDLENMLLDDHLAHSVVAREKDLRYIVRTGAALGLPIPGLMMALSYFDAFRSSRLPANLIMAQRDYFGAHTYSRVDAPGTFHTKWRKQ
jgi:6-phosphogluconate dehydrogenase